MNNAIMSGHLAHQRRWSDETFGPGKRLKGVLAHIREELDEVEASPEDIEEWADLLILVIDGATREGHSGLDIIKAYHEKMRKNREREWPAIPEGGWPDNVAVNHVRSALDPVKASPITVSRRELGMADDAYAVDGPPAFRRFTQGGLVEVMATPPEHVPDPLDVPICPAPPIAEVPC